MKRTRASLAVRVASAVVFMPMAAQALPLSYSTTFNGSSNVITGGGAYTSEAVPGSDFFGNAFLAPTNPDFPAAASYGFYDDYVFTIGMDAIANAVSSSVSLGSLAVANLQLRLYALPMDFGGNKNPGGDCPGGCLADWSPTLTSANVTYSVMDPLLLAAGTYVLEVRGDATGASGGSYSGVLNLAAVPLPGVAWLFGLALGATGYWRRRRPAGC
ncbi:MAG: hypothetical protein IT485_09815 [Gammaproteobacteria bacterium]|nr:hypothetical protein [Gammaproteobacteria bacterium]QOJ31046.1 MAG: hypothetical protein HRU81_02360 [Gammaproteobacteria bacterium]